MYLETRDGSRPGWRISSVDGTLPRSLPVQSIACLTDPHSYSARRIRPPRSNMVYVYVREHILQNCTPRPRAPGPATDHTRKTCVRLCDCVRHMCVMRHESCPRTKGACTPKGMQRSRVPHCTLRIPCACRSSPVTFSPLRPPREPGSRMPTTCSLVGSIHVFCPLGQLLPAFFRLRAPYGL